MRVGASAGVCDSSATVDFGYQRQREADNGKHHQHLLQGIHQSPQGDLDWSGYGESNPGSQLGKLMFYL